MKLKERNVNIDIMKGIAIVLMVLVHSSWPFDHFIGLFHMAVFFIASGYCYNDCYSDDVKGIWLLLKKRIKSLYLPYIFYNILFLLLNNVFVRIHIYANSAEVLKNTYGQIIQNTEIMSCIDILKQVFKCLLFFGGTQLAGAAWFLRDLFIITMMYVCVDWFTKKVIGKYKNELNFVIAIILLLLGYFCKLKRISILGLPAVFSCFCLFDIGTIIKRKKLIENNSRGFNITLSMICFVVLMLSTKQGEINLGGNEYPNPIFLLIVSLAGFLLLYEISIYVIKNQLIKKIFEYIGQNTIPIVFLHFLCFKIVNLIEILKNKAPLYMVASFPTYNGKEFWYVYTIVGILIPLIINWIYMKIKFVIKKFMS